MKIFLLVLMLVISPFGLASYHEAPVEEVVKTQRKFRGYGGGGGAIVGVLLIVGLVYFFTRDSYDEEEVKSELLAQKSSEPKKGLNLTLSTKILMKISIHTILMDLKFRRTICN